MHTTTKTESQIRQRLHELVERLNAGEATPQEAAEIRHLRHELEMITATRAGAGRTSARDRRMMDMMAAFVSVEPDPSRR